MTSHAYPGVAKFNPTYTARHREHTLAKGVGLIPHGDRQRAVFEYGENVEEERVSIDAYEKYLKK